MMKRKEWFQSAFEQLRFVFVIDKESRASISPRSYFSQTKRSSKHIINLSNYICAISPSSLPLMVAHQQWAIQIQCHILRILLQRVRRWIFGSTAADINVVVFKDILVDKPRTTYCEKKNLMNHIFKKTFPGD